MNAAASAIARRVFGLGGEEAEEGEAVGRQAGQGQRGDDGAGARDGGHRDAGGAGVADQLVAGVGDERRAGIGDQSHRLAAHPLDQARPDPVGIVIVIGQHRPLDADMVEQLGGDPAVLDGDQVGARQYVGGARAQIGEIADRGGDDIEAGLKRIVHREHRHGICSPPPASRPHVQARGVARDGRRCAVGLRAALAHRWRRRSRRRCRRRCAPSRRAGCPPTRPATGSRCWCRCTGGNAALGQSILNAANLALLDTGGQRIRITAYDTAAGAAAAANDALAEGNGLILGPLLAEDVRAVAPIARHAGVPVIAFSNDVSVAGDGVYLMGFTPVQSIQRVVSYAHAQGANRFGALVPTNVYGERAARAMTEAVEGAGGRLVGVQTFDPRPDRRAGRRDPARRAGRDRRGAARRRAADGAAGGADRPPGAPAAAPARHRALGDREQYRRQCRPARRLVRGAFGRALQPVAHPLPRPLQCRALPAGEHGL